MKHLDKLHAATVLAQQVDDLPDFLAQRIFAIVYRLQGREVMRAEIEALTEQVALYDTYGQTGYIGMGVSNDILEGTIRRLEQSLDAIQTDKG
jgi:stress response protein YsnF